MEKNRSAIVEQILAAFLHSGPAQGEQQARLFAQRILIEGVGSARLSFPFSFPGNLLAFAIFRALALHPVWHGSPGS